MARTTTILALLQTLLVVLGFCTLAIVLKLSGYPDPSMVRWNPLAVILRERGFLLLFAPLGWTLFAVIANRIDRGLFSFRLALLVGFSVAGIIIALFLYAAAFPYTRPILFHRF